MHLMTRVGVVAAFALGGVYMYVALRGPQGLPALEQKWNEIRDLQQRNAELKREVEFRADRIKKLEASPSEQELEIRRRLKMLRKGETTFITPGTSDGSNKPASETK